MTKPMQLCIVGGGTGGHVMPALALADAARENWPDLQVQFIGAERGLEATLLPKRGEKVLLLPMHAVNGVGLWQKLRVLCWEMPLAVRRIRQSWKLKRPNVVVGVGGYASATGVIAALLSRIPVVLYEQNAVPGLVNRTLARFCQHMMLGFQETASHLAIRHYSHTGNIVRQSIARTCYTNHATPCLLVLGGSQGARFLNQTVPQACAILRQEGLNFSVSHICGGEQETLQQCQQAYQDAGIKANVQNFCDDMAAFYATGDLMIARAGAMTIGEASAVGMPSIFIPLPHAANQHQYFNAYSLSRKNAALLFEQQGNDATSLATTLKETLFNSQKLQSMHKKTRQCAVDNAKQRQLHVLATWLEGGAA